MKGFNNSDEPERPQILQSPDPQKNQLDYLLGNFQVDSNLNQSQIRAKRVPQNINLNNSNEYSLPSFQHLRPSTANTTLPPQFLDFNKGTPMATKHSLAPVIRPRRGNSIERSSVQQFDQNFKDSQIYEQTKLRRNKNSKLYQLQDDIRDTPYKENSREKQLQNDQVHICEQCKKIMQMGSTGRIRPCCIEKLSAEQEMKVNKEQKVKPLSCYQSIPQQIANKDQVKQHVIKEQLKVHQQLLQETQFELEDEKNMNKQILNIIIDFRQRYFPKQDINALKANLENSTNEQAELTILEYLIQKNIVKLGQKERIINEQQVVIKQLKVENGNNQRQLSEIDHLKGNLLQQELSISQLQKSLKSTYIDFENLHNENQIFQQRNEEMKKNYEATLQQNIILNNQIVKLKQENQLVLSESEKLQEQKKKSQTKLEKVNKNLSGLKLQMESQIQSLEQDLESNYQNYCETFKQLQLKKTDIENLIQTVEEQDLKLKQFSAKLEASQQIQEQNKGLQAQVQQMKDQILILETPVQVQCASCLLNKEQELQRTGGNSSNKINRLFLSTDLTDSNNRTMSVRDFACQKDHQNKKESIFNSQDSSQKHLHGDCSFKNSSSKKNINKQLLNESSSQNMLSNKKISNQNYSPSKSPDNQLNDNSKATQQKLTFNQYQKQQNINTRAQSPGPSDTERINALKKENIQKNDSQQNISQKVQTPKNKDSKFIGNDYNSNQLENSQISGNSINKGFTNDLENLNNNSPPVLEGSNDDAKLNASKLGGDHHQQVLGKKSQVFQKPAQLNYFQAQLTKVIQDNHSIIFGNNETTPQPSNINSNSTQNNLNTENKKTDEQKLKTPQINEFSNNSKDFNNNPDKSENKISEQLQTTQDDGTESNKNNQKRKSINKEFQEENQEQLQENKQTEQIINQQKQQDKSKEQNNKISEISINQVAAPEANEQTNTHNFQQPLEIKTNPDQQLKTNELNAKDKIIKTQNSSKGLLEEQKMENKNNNNNQSQNQKLQISELNFDENDNKQNRNGDLYNFSDSPKSNQSFNQNDVQNNNIQILNGGDNSAKKDLKKEMEVKNQISSEAEQIEIKDENHHHVATMENAQSENEQNRADEINKINNNALQENEDKDLIDIEAVHNEMKNQQVLNESDQLQINGQPDNNETLEENFNNKDHQIKHKSEFIGKTQLNDKLFDQTEGNYSAVSQKNDNLLDQELSKSIDVNENIPKLSINSFTSIKDAQSNLIGTQ